MKQRHNSALSKRLTELVLEYKETRNQNLIPKIVNLSSGLIGAVYKYYGMLKFPSTVLEEISEDCQSFVLIRAIEAFTPSRKTAFSTFYTWRIKSHVRARKNYFIRRAALVLNTPSLDASRNWAEGFDSNGGTYHDRIGNPDYDYRLLSNYKRELAELFQLC